MKIIEVSIKEATIYVLKRWSSILLCALLMAAGFAGHKVFSTIVERRNIAVNAEAQQIGEANILSLQDKINENNKYIEEIRTSSNFTNKNKNEMVVDIVFNPNITNVFSLKEALEYYHKYAVLTSLFSGFVPDDYSESRLREITSLVFQNDVYGWPSRFTISAIGGDEIDSSMIVKALYNYLVESNSGIAGIGGEHSLRIISQSTLDIQSDDTLYNSEIAKRLEENREYSESISSIEEELKALHNKQNFSYATILSAAIVGGILGIVLGIIVASLVYFIKLIVVIPEQVQNQLGIRFLGGVKKKNGMFLGKVASRLAGDYLLMQDENFAAEYVSINIGEIVNKGEKILITSTISEDVARDVMNHLSKCNNLNGITFMAAGSINSTPRAIDMLLEADKVIVAERIDVSRLKDISRLDDRVKTSKKMVLGYVLF